MPKTISAPRRARCSIKWGRRPRGVFQIPVALLAALVALGGPSQRPARVAAINSVLDINNTFPYLIDKATGRLTEPRDYMDFENIYTPNDTYKLRQTAQGRNYHLLKAFDFANYFQSDYWHYSSRRDLERSAEPVANAAKCAEQLDWLETQLNRSNGQALYQPGEQHVQLMSLMDSFGRPEATTYFGHGYWLGSYHECKRVSISLAQFQLEECLRSADGGGGGPESEACHERRRRQELADEPIKFRYCIGKAHDSDWPTPEADNYVPRISYKVGLCLPEACETLTFAVRPQQLERLMRFNLAEHTRHRIKLHELYCLPDERSPIRRLPPSGRLFLALCSAWLLALVVATVVHSASKRHQADLCDLLVQEKQLDLERVKLTCGGASSAATTLEVDEAAAQNVANQKSARNNNTNNNNCADLSQPRAKMLLSGLIDDSQRLANGATTIGAGSRSNVSHQSSSAASSVSLSAWLAHSPALLALLEALSIEETLLEFKRPPRALVRNSGHASDRQPVVNLNALDAIKCLCCILVIFGHIVFIHMQHLSNIVHTIELSYEIYPRFLIALFNFVDTFFIISGMLTSYFIFKRFNRRSFASPLVWAQVSLLRLLRLSPVYILVLWFIKTTSVYMTAGPIWDYGTDRNSIKGLCVNDHWWKSLLYLGNWGTMQPICILPAWSIVVDAQYSLVTPLVIFLIFRHKRLGYLLLLLATVVSTTKMTWQLANQTAVNTSDMAKIRLHVYPLISRFAAEFYNTAWNRIGPVAIGILSGHMLYLYETGAIRRWPRFMYGRGFKLVLALHLLIFLLPVIGRFTDDPKSTRQTDTTIFITSNATIKPVWSVINSLLLLRLITDLRSHSVLARLMSHNIWHCLGKLCFTSYLIHYEIILTLLKTRETLLDPNWSNAFREFSAVFLISTAISYAIYILYEAPMNKLIMLAFASRANRLKREESGPKVARDESQLGRKPADEPNGRQLAAGLAFGTGVKKSHQVNASTTFEPVATKILE